LREHGEDAPPLAPLPQTKVVTLPSNALSHWEMLGHHEERPPQGEEPTGAGKADTSDAGLLSKVRMMLAALVCCSDVLDVLG